MPLRNRVTPFGEIVAAPGRGLLMGNRGILLDATRTLVRDSQVRRWIACRLEFRGRHRRVMSPGTWTELFFLDEATSLAAGHRPCAECRRADYRRFQTAWHQACAADSVQLPSADTMDAVLARERRIRPWVKRTHAVELATLPDGAFVVLNGQAQLVCGETLHTWSPERYVQHVARPKSGQVVLLTPPSIVAVLSAGYQAEVHPSAAPQPGAGGQPPSECTESGTTPRIGNQKMQYC